MLSLSCIRLAIVTASDGRSGSCVFERVRPVGLDLTTKRIDDDSREPEIEKPALRLAKDNEGRTMSAL
ncbi:hypothetical protein FOT77_16905 [Klebsiella michiganensis]|nr:hypothetical protein [Klebsiella michiganensis]MBE0200030.1 hypothetical protein [Klebsiella michiganensis]